MSYTTGRASHIRFYDTEQQAEHAAAAMVAAKETTHAVAWEVGHT